MTFSILAYSAKTKQIGLAQASCGLFTGSVCPIVCPSGKFIGTTQAYVNRNIKTDILHVLALSNSIISLDAELKALDNHYKYRQIAILGFDGQAYAHTGENVTGQAGHYVAENFIVSGNMLTNIECLDAMSEEFERGSELVFAERLLNSLIVCQKAGGQKAEGRYLRERAANLMVYDEAGSCHINLRIDMAVDSVKALTELWRAYRVYNQFMEVAERSPENLKSLSEQDNLMPFAPSIFKDQHG